MRFTRRVLFTRAIALTVAVGLGASGCGGDDSDPDSADPAGIEDQTGDITDGEAEGTPAGSLITSWDSVPECEKSTSPVSNGIHVVASCLGEPGFNLVAYDDPHTQNVISTIELIDGELIGMSAIGVIDVGVVVNFAVRQAPSGLDDGSTQMHAGLVGFDGQLIWDVPVTSPASYEDGIVVTHEGESADCTYGLPEFGPLVGLDAATGEQVWTNPGGSCEPNSDEVLDFATGDVVPSREVDERARSRAERAVFLDRSNGAHPQTDIGPILVALENGREIWRKDLPPTAQIAYANGDRIVMSADADGLAPTDGLGAGNQVSRYVILNFANGEVLDELAPGYGCFVTHINTDGSVGVLHCPVDGDGDTDWFISLAD